MEDPKSQNHLRLDVAAGGADIAWWLAQEQKKKAGEELARLLNSFRGTRYAKLRPGSQLAAQEPGYSEQARAQQEEAGRLRYRLDEQVGAIDAAIPRVAVIVKAQIEEHLRQEALALAAQKVQGLHKRRINGRNKQVAVDPAVSGLGIQAGVGFVLLIRKLSKKP
jgi:hypothetical protein